MSFAGNALSRKTLLKGTGKKKSGRANKAVFRSKISKSKNFVNRLHGVLNIVEK